MENDIKKLIMQVEDLYDKKIIKNRLEKLQVSNFRKFSMNSLINFSFPLTVFIGKNGSGKTSIMKTIKILSTGQIP